MLNVCKDLDMSKNILIFASLKKETIMAHFDISEIVNDYCEKHGLEYVNTTDGQNGYPSCVKVGIIAFTNSQQLMEVQDDLQSIFGDKADVNIEILSKKDGWSLYSHNSRFTHVHDYGFTLEERGLVDVTVPTDTELDNYVHDCIKEMTDYDIRDFETLRNFVDVAKEVWEKSSLLIHDGHVVVAPMEYFPHCGSEIIDIDEPLVMQYHDDDVTFYAYGLVIYPNDND